MACAMGNLSCVQQLLSAPGIDVNVKNGHGETAVMIAKDYHVLVLLKKYSKICDDFPIHTVGKVVLCGNTGAGKSTLTKVLSILLLQFIYRVLMSTGCCRLEVISM